MKRYKITIVEIGQERSVVPKRWVMGAGKSPTEYGYAPEVETVVSYEREVYTQEVSGDSLYLYDVIKAVNGG